MFQHHAYLAQQLKLNTDQALQALGTNLSEIEYFSYHSLCITDVRKLTGRAYMRPQLGDKKILVVTASDMTVEAQQALLKLLEEPPLTSVFLFVLPLSAHLLSTLHSRFFRLNLDVEPFSDSTFTEFVSLGLAARVDLITDRIANKDKDWVNEIKLSLMAKLINKQIPTSMLSLVPVLNFIVLNLETRGSSNKQLLEELALTWPVGQQKNEKMVH